MSETITAALAAVAAEVGAVRKDGRNQSQGFSFRGIDAVVNAVAPALRKHQVLGPVPELVSLERESAGTSRNGVQVHAVPVTYRDGVYLLSDDGERTPYQIRKRTA